jgi:hypothetical protein
MINDSIETARFSMEFLGLSARSVPDPGARMDTGAAFSAFNQHLPL